MFACVQEGESGAERGTVACTYTERARATGEKTENTTRTRHQYLLDVCSARLTRESTLVRRPEMMGEECAAQIRELPETER